MKKFLYSIAAAMILAACSSEDKLTTMNESESNLVPMTFTASQEGETGTRAGLNADERTKINWQEGDAISINEAEFTLSSGAGTGTGAFSGTTAEAEKYIAVYPYTGNETYDSEGQVSGVVLPSEQTVTAGSFDPKAALMMAVSSSKSLEFKNAVGFIKVTPQFDCKKIILRAADKTVPLAGKGTLKYNDGQPYIDFTNSTEYSYTINLSGTITSGKDYYIAVPAKQISAKWTLTFVTETETYIRQSSSAITFERSKALNLGTFESTQNYWVSGPRGIVSEDQEVDLGISVTIGTKEYKVKFAKSNLTVTGLAASETDLGDYFAWGAIEPWCISYSGTSSVWKEGKSDGYTLDNCPSYDNSEYEENEVLKMEYDPARQILGGDWQLPTKEIWQALVNHTTKGWDNNSKGYKFEKNSQALFLPAAGNFLGNNMRNQKDTNGCYWSGTTSSTNVAYFISFWNDEVSAEPYTERCNGYTVRPVRLVAVN